MRKKIQFAALLTLAGITASTSLGESLMIEAESGVVTAPFTVTNGYLYQPFQTGITGGGRAVYDFTITNAGVYVILAAVNSPRAATNSFYVSIDGEPKHPASVWEFPASTGFTEHIVACRGNTSPSGHTLYTLTRGAHQLIIRGLGAEAQLDRLSLLKVPESRPAPPGNLRIVSTP